MSTIQATNLKNALSTNNNAVMSASGDLTNAAGISYMGGSKNLLINSAMQVAQRGTSVASITGDSYNTADRWRLGASSLGTWTQSVESDGPTGSGLTKSLKMLCTTADAAPSAGDFLVFGQRLEGQDLQRIAKGTSSAQQLTLSFWVKSNVTGTYVVELYDADNNRTISATYSISASATWEKKTITAAADTTGTLTNDNGLSFEVNFWLGAGSSFTSGTLQTTWGSVTAANRAVGQTNLAAATNNYWQITGTQLEIGPVATSFEFEPYETTLRKCQRYYQKVVTTVAGYNSATQFFGAFVFPVTPRTQPISVTVASGNTIGNVDGGYTTSSSTADFITTHGARIVQNSSGMTSGRGAVSLGVVIEVNAEL